MSQSKMGQDNFREGSGSPSDKRLGEKHDEFRDDPTLPLTTHKIFPLKYKANMARKRMPLDPDRQER